MSDALFKQLYDNYFDRLVAVARLYVRDKMAAEDLVADSFVRLYRVAAGLGPDVKLEAYLTTIVKNQCLNYLKSLKIHQNAQREMDLHAQRMVDASIRTLSSLEPEHIFASEVQRLVSEAVESMPEKTRQVFTESRYSDKTYQEIAEELGLTRRQVHSEMQKALTILRLALKDFLPEWLLILYLQHLFR